MAQLKGTARTASAVAFAVLWSSWALTAWAADYPAPREASWVARDFRLHTGEMMPELQLNYRTIGAPTGEPVLVLHGTAGTGASMLTPAFAGELFGAGQALDAARYYIIIPDTLGHGKSSKPSDGLRTQFPKYNYEDMVDAHYRLLTEHLKVPHLRVVIGNSMGGMETWIFAVKYAGLHGCRGADGLFAHRDVEPQLDVASPDHRFDPQRPRLEGRRLHAAAAKRPLRVRVLRHRHQRGNQALYKAAPTREKADQLLDAAPCRAVYRRCQRRSVPVGLLARLQPSPGPREDQGDGARHQCRRRRAQSAGARLAGSRDQTRQERPRAVDSGERDTAGHGTTGMAKFYQRELREVLQSAPHLGL